jgi:hypothetical protein
MEFVCPMTGQEFSAERLATAFVDYLYDEYQGSRHIRRVPSWLGLLVLGVEKIKSGDWHIPRVRQLTFDVGDHRYKMRYDHHAGPRGGIQIVEIAKTQGSPEIRVVKTISSLADAEAFYLFPSL